MLPKYPPKLPRPDPEVISVLKQYRAALDGREAALMQDMARRWLEIERRLDADITALAYEVARRRDAGETVTDQMIWRMNRYKIIHGQMDEQIRLYNRDYAVNTIRNAQIEYSTLGIRSAQDAIFVSLGPTGGTFNRINIGAVQSMIGFAGDGSPLYTLLRNDYPDAVNGLLNALVNGMARGQGAAQTAREMANGMGMGLDRALLIARTEAARAYRTSSSEQYRQSGVVTGFRRLVKKETACMACLALDGQTFRLEEELTDHPRGRCDLIPIVAGVRPARWQTGLEWFETLSPEEQRARMGGTRYELWRDGQIQLTDLASMRHDDTWGDSPAVTPVRDLVKE